MEGTDQTLILAGSLAAVFALFLLVKWLKLGSSSALRSQDDAARAAGEVEDGFQTAKASISRRGDSALVREEAGRIMVIKSHGNQFAGRILTSAASAREEVDALIVDPGANEKAFGPVRLQLEDAANWADAINRL